MLLVSIWSRIIWFKDVNVQIRSGVDIVISYFTIPDRFRLIGAKIDAKVTETLSFDILGKRIKIL